LLYVAALLEEGTRTPDVDYCIVGRQLVERKKLDAVREIFRELLVLRRKGTPADMIKTACCDVLQLGPRRRMPSRDELTLHFWIRPAQRLLDKNRDVGMTIAQADEKAYVQRMMEAFNVSQEQAQDALEETKRTGNWAWLDEGMKEVAHVTPDVGRPNVRSTCCVSKVFPNLKRGMASYWRRSNPEKFNACKAAMKRLLRKMLRSSGARAA
jgi:hypothetical protein